MTMRRAQSDSVCRSEVPATDAMRAKVAGGRPFWAPRDRACAICAPVALVSLRRGRMPIPGSRADGKLPSTVPDAGHQARYAPGAVGHVRVPSSFRFLQSLSFLHREEGTVAQAHHVFFAKLLFARMMRAGMRVASPIERSGDGRSTSFLGLGVKYELGSHRR